MTGSDDAMLVAGVRRGDREAAAALIERYLKGGRSVALAIVRDQDAAEDVCQDAFVYAIERIDDCRQPDRFGAWFMQIVRSRSHNFIRDSRGALSSPAEEVPLAAPDPSPESAAEREEIRRRLVEALREIPEDRATVLLLHDLEGWTHREIADRMELPSGTVRSHLYHARIRLRDLLRDFSE